MEKAVVLAEKKFSTTDGKTAHGLVRYSKRYFIVGVIDSELAGLDTGEFLDGKRNGIKIYASLEEALRDHPDTQTLIIGVATAGGILPPGYREIVKESLKRGLNIVSGLHEFLSEDPELLILAKKKGVQIIDVRKLYRDMKIFYTGKIQEVKCIKIAVLGTDSTIGKRTTAILLTETLNRLGLKAVFVGTGQTAWMQGAKYGVVMDAMINDFVAGGIEHEIWRAYKEEKPDVIIVPGQGSIVHPAFPGGFEILAAGRPDVIILQHAPKRPHLDGFPEYPLPKLERVIKIIELLTEKKVVAITINHEKMSREEVKETVEKYEKEYGVVVCAPLIEGMGKVAATIINMFPDLRVKVKDEKLKMYKMSWNWI